MHPSPLRVRRAAPILGLIAVVGLGCATSARVENQSLETYRPGKGYGAQLSKSAFVGNVRVLLAFLGGGTRAAALAYGVLKELRDTEVRIDGEKKRLLDAVTTISSVSGGSFASAYYGLKGDGIFEDFEERFLRRNIDRRLAINLVRPLEALRIAFTPYTRSDMAMDLYDKEVFDGATFADLEAAGGPPLNINATDIAAGSVFTFIQPDFDLICSDLSKLETSRAVTASSAVPGIFSPLRLENFAGTCGMPEPEWIEYALAHPAENRRRHHQARTAVTYLDAKQRPNIFLVDGGVADNIGARRILSDVIDSGGVWELIEKEKITLPETLILIVVNAQVGGHQSWEDEARDPSLGKLLSAISGIGIYRYNFETVQLLRESAAEWVKESKQRGTPFDAFVSEVAFDNIKDADERAFFNQVDTSFNLDDTAVDRLIEVGGRLLRESPDFKQFLAEVQ